MSALGSRTNHLYEGLTARERAILELEATKADERPTPLIRLMMPDSQTAEFNGYMRQLRVLSQVVGAYSLVLEREVGLVQSQLLLLSVLVLWGEDREPTVALTGKRPRSKPARRDDDRGPHSAWQILPALAPSPEALLPPEERTAADELLHRTGERVRREVARLSGALLAVDAAVAEVAAGLGGNDPLHPSIRESLEGTRAAMDVSRQQVATFVGELDPPARDEASFEVLRGLLGA